MPLLNQTPVAPLPLPSLLSELSGNTSIWIITQTAELFTDYEFSLLISLPLIALLDSLLTLFPNHRSYANRYLFYSQPIFTPDLPHAQSSHPQPISFFQALNLEHQRLDHLLQSKFPSTLTPRLLSSLLLPSAQLQPNIDHLVDHLYDLYHNRFDVDETIVVDLAFNQSPPASSRHDARIVRVFPPKPIRDLDKKSYSDLIHFGAMHRFQLDLNKCLQVDDPEAYLYTIQLINKQGSKSDNFGASYMEVETQKLGLNERRCRFEEFDNGLDDLTARLVKLILRQIGLRYPNTSPNKFTSISVLPFFATRPVQECNAMSIDEREYWVRKGIRFLNVHRRLNESSQSTSTHKKKLNRGAVEEDWVMGLVEVMCDRGGIERLGCMARVFKYLFSANATLLTIDHTCDEDYKLDNSSHPHQKCNSKPNTCQTNPPARTLDFDGDSPLTSNIDESSEGEDGNLSVEGADVVEDVEPESGVETGDEDGRRYGRSIPHQRDQPKQLRKTLASRFTGLPAEDKLTLIDFLCELAMESDQVRNYMEECDEKLTIVRKEKADINKEKRKVLEELTRLENRKAASTPKVPPSLSSEELTSTQDCELSPIIDRSKSNGTTLSMPARPMQSSEAAFLGSPHSHQPGEDTKLKLTESKPISSIMSLSKPAPSVDLTSKPLSPNGKTNIRKPESPKQSSNRPLDTHVRIATLTARQIRQPTYLATNEVEIEKQQLENRLFEIGLKELQLQERFRQLIGVTKLKPLGADRFSCKYWWFDGIGGMEIHSEDDDKKINESNQSQSHPKEEEIKWYSGCLFVSGPSIEEWDKICESYGGYDQVSKRRLREEFGCTDDHDLSLHDHLSSKTQLVGIDEWGIYETEVQIEELMTWLNSKGIRENHLKMNLKEWKEYITYGIQCRNKSLSSSATTLTIDHQIKNTNPKTIENQKANHHSIQSNGEKNQLSRLENNNHNHNSIDDCSDSSNHGSSSLGSIDSIATDESFVGQSDHLDDGDN